MWKRDVGFDVARELIRNAGTEVHCSFCTRICILTDLKAFSEALRWEEL